MNDNIIAELVTFCGIMFNETVKVEFNKFLDDKEVVIGHFSNKNMFILHKWCSQVD